MSKKSKKQQFRIRLDNLFAELSDLEGGFDLPPELTALAGAATSPGWVWACDGDGVYTACSPEVEAYLGYTDSELIGQKFSEFALTPQTGAEIENVLHAGPFPAEVRAEFQHKDGGTVGVSLHVFSGSADNGAGGWNGFAQVLAPAPDAKAASPLPPITADILKGGLVVEGDSLAPTGEPLSDAGQRGSERKPSIQKTVDEEGRAVLAAPVTLQQRDLGLLEIVDDDPDRVWSEDDLLLIEQVADQLSQALENASLFQQTQKALADTDEQARRLRILNQMSEALNQASGVDDIFTIAVDKSGQIFKAAVSAISLLTTDRQTLVVRAVAGDSPDLKTGARMPVAENGDLIAIAENRVVVDPPIGEGEAAEGEATLTAPLVVGGQVIGVLNVRRPPSVWTADEVTTADAITEQVGLALEKQRLFDLAQQRAREAQERSEELALVNRVVTTVAASMELKQSLEVVATELNRALSIDEAVVALFNEAGTELIVVAGASKTSDLPSAVGWVIPIADDPVAQKMVSTRKPIVLSGAKANPEARPLQDLVHARDYETVVLCPLVAGQEVIGTALLANRVEGAHLSEDEQRLAETIVFQAATAIQNAQLFEQTEAALSETAYLYQASAELNAVQSLDDILQILLNYTIVGQEAQYVSVDLFPRPARPDQLPETLASVAHRVVTGDPLDWDGNISLHDWSDSRALFQPGQVTVVHDLADDPRLDPPARTLFVGKLGAASLLVAPLVSAGQWLGALLTTYSEPIDFPESELRRLETLAGQAAVAIQNIRLLEETTRKASQLETAAEIARDTSSTLDLDLLMNRAINLIRERFGFYHASIYMVETNRVVVKAATGEAGAELVNEGDSVLLRPGESLVGQVAYSGEPLVLNDVSASELFAPSPVLPETKAEVGLPLKVGQRVIGVLNVHSDRLNAFGEDDVAVLQTLADQLSVAVDNARSFELAQKAVEEMRELDRLKNQFLANMSHELRTPLNSIIGFSRVILKGIDGPITDLQKQDLDAIYASGQHLLDMINSILDLSKIEAGRMELSIEDFQVGDVVKNVLTTAAGLVQEKSLQLVNHVPERLPAVHADRTRVRQVLLNLLQNAVKFTEQGSIEVGAQVMVGAQDQSELVVWVKDTGIGIAPNDQEKLFEPFSQVDDSPTRKTGGSGLGLSISHRLLELQGGRIWLESEPGVGSTFYFSLPVASETKSNGKAKATPLADTRVVLAIDDDENVTGLYGRYLRDRGFQVVPLTDPNRALFEVKRLKPAAVTLDIMMPDLDGWQVLQRLKADPQTKDVPVVICSIHDDKEQGFKLGADDYLVKPILEDDLVKAVERLLQ